MPGFAERSAIDASDRLVSSEPKLELRLLTGSLTFRDMQEFRRALRHRYVLANFFALIVPAIVLLSALDNTAVPIELKVPTVLMGLVAAQLIFLGYVAAVMWLTRLTRGEGPITRVWVTLGLMLGASGLLAIMHVMNQVLDGQQTWTGARSRLIAVVCWLYLELAAHHVLRGPMPRALANLRGEAKPVKAGDAVWKSPADPVTQDAVSAHEENAATERSDFLIRLGIAAEDIWRLEASGNYVTVVTRGGRQLVPGPFSTVVAQMPAGLGRQVQRSHWVATSGIEGVRKQGREVWLQMACGALVPVSAAIKSEIMNWLEATGKAGRLIARRGPGARNVGRVAP